MTETASAFLRARGDDNRVRFPEAVPVRLALRGFAAELPWSAEGRDLVELASGVLIADRLVRRHGVAPRRVEVRLAVRRPDVWRRAEPELRNVLAILTGDRFTFRFRQARSREWLLPSKESPASPRELDRIVLFSGGLDSACGAARLARRRLRTGYVSQYAKGLRRLERLLDDIHTGLGSRRHYVHAGFFVQPTGPVVRRLREHSRRSRSFLFVALALATAEGSAAREIWVCENGPLALNLPLSPEMQPTRHAHSQFLGAMQGLAAAVFGRSFRIVNPFELKTKGEMTRVFSGHPELALSTNSCWSQQWSGRGSSHGKGHCGHCLPCLVRLASLTAAGIEAPAGHFDLDVRLLARKSRLSAEERRRLGPVRMLTEFAHRVDQCRTWRTFVQRFPAALESEPTTREMLSEQWYRELSRTLRRFAGEVLECYTR